MNMIGNIVLNPDIFFSDNKYNKSIVDFQVEVKLFG
jgi:hypothetical protein